MHVAVQACLALAWRLGGCGSGGARGQQAPVGRWWQALLQQPEDALVRPPLAFEGQVHLEEGLQLLQGARPQHWLVGVRRPGPLALASS